MPQYLISVIGNTADAMPPEDEMQALYASVDAFNKEVQAAGQWVFAGGLQPIDEATVVDGTGDDVVVTDGPFSESKEFLGGFWVVDVPDMDAALDLATRGSKACQGKVEVRAFQAEPDGA